MKPSILFLFTALLFSSALLAKGTHESPRHIEIHLKSGTQHVVEQMKSTAIELCKKQPLPLGYFLSSSYDPFGRNGLIDANLIIKIVQPEKKEPDLQATLYASCSFLVFQAGLGDVQLVTVDTAKLRQYRLYLQDGHINDVFSIPNESAAELLKPQR